MVFKGIGLSVPPDTILVGCFTFLCMSLPCTSAKRRFAARNGGALDEQHCCLLNVEFQGRSHQPRGQPPSLSCFLRTFPALWAGQTAHYASCTPPLRAFKVLTAVFDLADVPGAVGEYNGVLWEPHVAAAGPPQPGGAARAAGGPGAAALRRPRRRAGLRGDARRCSL